MKLIDLDKAVSISDADDNAVIWTNIKNAEVKAIPIEWIEEYTKRLVIKRRFLAENGYRDNRCYDYMFGIIGMLDDWDKEIREKENEAN